MKLEFDKKKGAEALSELVQGPVNWGKKAAAGAKAGVTAIVEKSKADEYARRLKKYNPLFPEQYQSETFNIPNIIVIVDDAVRKGIDVCEGAIGWLSKESGEEVLHLYDEAISFSGIQFVPAPVCNAVYYVDHFDRGRFIQADCIFSRKLKEMIDELQHIAEFVGAKRCTIDISESISSADVKQRAANLSVGDKKTNGNATLDYSAASKSYTTQQGHIEVTFTGLRFPKRPTLKWFANDNGINNLVEACCLRKRRVKELTLELLGSSSATMSQSIACAIDGIITKSLGGNGHASIASRVQEEHQRVLKFHIEF